MVKGILYTYIRRNYNNVSFRILLTIFLFIIRAFATGVFQAIFVYTPEVYPTTVRAFALGTCSAAARIGAIITPYTAQVSDAVYVCMFGCMSHGLQAWSDLEEPFCYYYVSVTGSSGT